jgi:glycosyltransferase involved in cell wall biosynthesis
MARVMMIGYGPLPRAGQEYTAAPTLRTRHLLKPVVEAGHTVYLYTLPIPGTEGPEGAVSAMTPDNYEGMTYQRFSNHSGEFAIQTLSEQVRQREPDAIVGVNTYPAYVACMLSSALPVWADLNGYWMAETQGRCMLDGDDARLMEAWAIERAIVRRADKFSAVSRPQLHAVLGEMASVGRLNRHNFNYQLGHHIANAAYRWPGPRDPADADEPVLRGPIVPSDAFIILWSGGFNVWCDIETMIQAVDQLMADYPSVHFVSTGGRIEGVVTETFQQFQELVDDSPYKGRYHHLGWVASEKLPRIYREANVGINVDARNYETLFGARNRLNAMAAEGLAIATTLGTEISEWLDDGNAALTAPMGDPEGLAAAIEPWIEQPEELRNYGANGRRIMEDDFSYERTTRALTGWLEDPCLAPDNQRKVDSAQGALDDLNAVAANPLEEMTLLLMRYRPDDLREMLDEIEENRRKPKRKFW